MCRVVKMLNDEWFAAIRMGLHRMQLTLRIRTGDFTLRKYFTSVKTIDLIKIAEALPDDEIETDAYHQLTVCWSIGNLLCHRLECQCVVIDWQKLQVKCLWSIVNVKTN